MRAQFDPELQLRAAQLKVDPHDSIVAAWKKTRFSKDGTFLTFGVESPFLRKEITGPVAKGCFHGRLLFKRALKLPVEAFVEFLDDIVDNDTKKQVRNALVRDKQLPDMSFKALATGVMGTLGEKLPAKSARNSLADLSTTWGNLQLKRSSVS